MEFVLESVQIHGVPRRAAFAHSQGTWPVHALKPPCPAVLATRGNPAGLHFEKKVTSRLPRTEVCEGCRPLLVLLAGYAIGVVVAVNVRDDRRVVVTAVRGCEMRIVDDRDHAVRIVVNDGAVNPRRTSIRPR